MHIGILETDSLDEEIIEKHGSYADMFQHLLLSVDDKLKFTVYNVMDGIFPGYSDECDGYLITGSKASVYEDEAWIKSLSDYIVELHENKKKLVGICFGHQLIAHALGGTTEKSDKGWGVGVHKTEVHSPQIWMSDTRTDFAVIVSHQDQVSTLPTQAIPIASNDHCLHSSYQIGNHILAFQGHPEFSVDYHKHSLNKRREIIGEEVFQQGLDSLHDEIDNLIVAQWIIKFMRI